MIANKIGLAKNPWCNGSYYYTIQIIWVTLFPRMPNQKMNQLMYGIIFLCIQFRGVKGSVINHGAVPNQW